MDTPDATVPLFALLEKQRAAHLANPPGYRQRVDDLSRLRGAFKSSLEVLAAAVAADFGRRSRHETLVADGMTVLHDIDHALSELRHWMKPRRVPVDWTFWPARAEIRYQPVGVVGVISPWNYPINLALMPLAAAIAAGNHVMLKPSEHTPRTSDALRDLLSRVFPEERVTTVIGEADVAQAFSELPFDHLFFTGSTAVGQRVMAAAAKHLTPVTLELGGKSPAIIARDFPLKRAAERIAQGKFFNAGQTCIAPDYVLLPRARIDAFATALREQVAAAYPESSATSDYTAVVNARQHDRLRAYVDDAKRRGAKVVELAAGDADQRVFPPTLILDAPPGSLVLQEEIFGPILPLVASESIDDAIRYVNDRPRPLALYHFDDDAKRTERVLDGTIAGGVTINDTMMHFAQAELPFGGVGPSGVGSYHGHQGFLTFSKQKPVLYQARVAATDWLRPPYKRFADFMVRFLTR